ncbi:hypothetical protein [Ruegeria sp. HKCCD8929]|uniref:hypothetical protein n=1 Tax=Ruegeria sp. HKCCD8929 TaxID=2683006 RepID=UPI00148833C0|nr:hypothetical protein [Ruegeria sp. HKCCD8929]
MNQDIAARERLENLAHLSELVERRSSSSREFRRAVGTLFEDLKYVDEALRRDPLTWRLNRAFHAVHAPSLIAVISMLDDIERMTSVTEDETHQIYSSINQAALLAKDARRRIEQANLTEVKVELEVLAEYAPPPAKRFQKASKLTLAFDSIASVSESAWGGAKSSASSVPGLIGSLQDGVSDTVSRAASVPLLAENLRKTLSGALSDNVSKPISMRLKAGGRALENGVGTGVGFGVIVGVLCPPLLPLTAGGAVLAAMRTWRKEMDKASTLNEIERQQRIAELKAERSAALKRLTHGAAALQMETEDLSMTLDVETGQADAVILNGDYSGRNWSNLTATEKAEAGLTLVEGTNNLLRILEMATGE